MKAAKTLTAARFKLKDIYERHDVGAFRAFLRKEGQESPELLGYINSSDEVLSEMMYEAKSQLMYLGEVWQDARNYLRAKKFGYTEDIKNYPKCASCTYFRESPSEGEHPCMQIGSTPADVVCLGYKAIRQN